MSLTDWIWLSVAAYGIHILEEYQLDWRNWARAVIKLPVEWPDFYVVNALVIVLGIVAAELAATQPVLALIFPAVMLINGTFFHILPFVTTGGRFSPGLVTAVLLFWPIGVASYAAAAGSGRVGTTGVIASLVIGAILMACPVVLLKIKHIPYLRQDR
jgi:hypothetical protein